MKGITFCVVLCFVSLNAMPSGLDNRLRLIERLRRRGGAATLGEEITGGVTGSISTSIGAIAGLALSILEAIGGGIIGIGDKSSSGLITGLTNVHHLRRSQRRIQPIENLLNSPQQLDKLKRREIADLLRRRVVGGVDTLRLLDGLRRRGGAANIGEEVAGGVTGSISTSLGAIAGLILSAVEAIGGGLVGIGDRTSSGLVNGLTGIKHLRRSLTSESNDLEDESVDEPWDMPWDVPLDWVEDLLLLSSPDFIRSILLSLGDLNFENSGLGIVRVGDIDTGDVGVAGVGKVNDITIN